METNVNPFPKTTELFNAFEAGRCAQIADERQHAAESLPIGESRVELLEQALQWRERSKRWLSYGV